jgi:hypothetical protein
MGRLTSRERVLIGAVALIVALILIGVLLYALNVASVATLRWWAGVATLALPLTGIVTFFLGRMEARGHVAGLTQGIEAVSRAAQGTADIRVTTAQRMRRRSPQPAVQQVFLPAGMPPGATGAGVILPPRREEEDVEL